MGEFEGLGATSSKLIQYKLQRWSNDYQRWVDTGSWRQSLESIQRRQVSVDLEFYPVETKTRILKKTVATTETITVV